MGIKVVRSHGCTVVDRAGKEYLDLRLAVAALRIAMHPVYSTVFLRSKCVSPAVPITEHARP